MDPVVAAVQEMDANASSAPAAEPAQTGQPAAAPLPDPAAPRDSELLTRRTRRVSIAEGSNKGFEQKAPLRVFEPHRGVVHEVLEAVEERLRARVDAPARAEALHVRAHAREAGVVQGLWLLCCVASSKVTEIWHFGTSAERGC